MAKRGPAPRTERIEIPEKVYRIMERRGAEVIRAVGHLPDTTIREIAMCGYLQGLEDMQRAIFNNPQVLRQSVQVDDWQLP